jgi:hypothetical protein
MRNHDRRRLAALIPSPFGRGKGEGALSFGNLPLPRPSLRHGGSSTGGRGRTLKLFAAAAVCISIGSAAIAAALPEVTLVQEPGKVLIAVDGRPVATYVHEDPKITRPYFAHVHSPSGVQVTRNYPPVEGQDLMDHPLFHPGIWLAFGDVSGSDYWRLKAAVVHDSFVEPPTGGSGEGRFAVRNRYIDQQDDMKTVCEETCRYRFLVRPEGYLLTWDSTFSSDEPFYFGDQEEMGLGIRVATPIRVEKGKDSLPDGNGTMVDAEGRRNEAEIKGQSSAWCDYSGTLDGRRVGMTLMCHPDNFRPSWFHARDYGFLEANPFGRAAFRKGEKSKVEVKPGQTLRLRYGILIHSGPEGGQSDRAAAYRDYLDVSGK